ncbi:MAG: rhodanese-like domain-containing protein [Holophaga sp.]|nr:rhodanese-like domain-containing protein [Holophaga sp.]
MPKPVPDLLKALTLLVAALVCAGLANVWARTDRKLDWMGWAPPAATPQTAAAAPAPPSPAPPPPTPAARATPAAPAPAVIEKAARAPRKPDAQFAPSPQEVIREISSPAAWDAFQLKIPFLDARRSEEFAAGHVPGAWSIPIWEANAAARITEFEARANPQSSAPIAIYCSGGDCADSKLLAKRLVDLGYRNLLIYRDGFPDWLQRGRPKEQGARP